MSFSTETKNELSRSVPEKKCCQLAEIAGFLRVSGSLRLAGGGKFKIVISTDNPAVARHYKKLIKEYFQVETELEVGEAPGPKKGRAYFLTIGPEMRSEQILRGNRHPAGAGRQQLHIRRHLQRFDQDKVLQKVVSAWHLHGKRQRQRPCPQLSSGIRLRQQIWRRICER